MLIIRASWPALWRMQTLDYIDGSWTVPSDPLPELPEPGAKREEVQVRVVGLREDLAVAPGRIERLNVNGSATPSVGEGMQLAPAPPAGTSYRIEAAFVHPTAAQLSRDRAPLDQAAREYTRLRAPTDPRKVLRRFGWLAALPGLFIAIDQHPLDPRVVALARRLARGARTEWQIVTRVERYLLDGGRFRYTTNVPDPGPQPLVDFLLRSHDGYCQQFAGAAALLLRLDGVPARVASGFATGKQTGPDRYTVRDLDAHEWIEVYFEGYGWVPFNPTPAGDPALVAGGIDPFQPRAGPDRARDGVYLAVAIVLMTAATALLRALRPSRPASTEWFWRVARRAGVELGPSTTLAEIRVVLAARVGPRTAATAHQIERERFARDPLAGLEPSRIRVARALISDLGLLGSLLFWVPGPRPHRGRETPLSSASTKPATRSAELSHFGRRLE
jgi:transglutaminase-like putative cysteine protease